MYPMHPDDEPSPRFGGWADDFNTYEEACAYYGADTPAMLAAEAAADEAEWWIARQDEVEIRGGATTANFRPMSYVETDEIPF